MALRKLFFVYFQFSTVFNGILFTEISTVTCTSINDSTALDLLRPRFKIPLGSLSRYQQPQWEILYFFKYGSLPISSNNYPQFNRTDFLNKMRLIKALWDMDKDIPEVSDETINANESHENANSIENDFRLSSSEKDGSGITMVNKLGRSKFNARKILPSDEFVPIVRKYRRLHPLLRVNSWKPPTSTAKRSGQLPNALAQENYEVNRARIAEAAVERNARRKFQTQGWK